MVPSRPSSPFLSRRRFATRPDAPLHGSRRPSKRRVYRSDCGVETPARCPRRQRGASQPCNADEMRNVLDADEFPAEHTRPRNTTMVVAITSATLMLDRLEPAWHRPRRTPPPQPRSAHRFRRRRPADIAVLPGWFKLTAAASFPAARRRTPHPRRRRISHGALCGRSRLGAKPRPRPASRSVGLQTGPSSLKEARQHLCYGILYTKMVAPTLRRVNGLAPRCAALCGPPLDATLRRVARSTHW